MKEIELTNGGVTKVDDEDFEKFSKWNWQNVGGYARRCEYVSTQKIAEGKFRSKNNLIHLHREINNTPTGLDTDHINGDRLDNRRSNLRNATRSKNAHNSLKKRSKSKSKLLGAQWRADRSKWRSYICINGKDKYLGSFDTELAAHQAYMKEKGKIWQ